MKDRQKDGAKKALREELSSDIQVDEFTQNELDLKVFKNTDTTIPLDEYDLNDTQYNMLVKKMKYERIGYYLRIVLMVGIVTTLLLFIYHMNSLVFRLILVTVVMIVVMLFNSKSLRNTLA
jgi:hypothetical protein